VSVNADRPKDFTDQSHGGNALTDDLATTRCLGTKACSYDLFETTIRTLCVLICRKCTPSARRNTARAVGLQPGSRYFTYSPWRKAERQGTDAVLKARMQNWQAR
jgi:hypothetical protein